MVGDTPPLPFFKLKHVLLSSHVIVCRVFTFTPPCTTLFRQLEVAMWNGKEGLNDNIFGVVNDDLVVIGEEMVDGVLGAGEKGGGGEFKPREEGE